MHRATNVICEDVETSIVGVGLLLQAVPNIVLGDEVPGERVQATRPKAGHEQIDERALAECRDENVVEDKLCHQVDEVPLRQGLRAYKAWSKCVEQDLERPTCHPYTCEDIVSHHGLSRREHTRRTPCQGHCLGRSVPSGWAGQYRFHPPQGTCGVQCDISVEPTSPLIRRSLRKRIAYLERSRIRYTDR